MPITQSLNRAGYPNIRTLTANPTAIFFEAGMMIDASGAHHIYQPQAVKSLNNLGNIGSPGNFGVQVTDTGMPSSDVVLPALAALKTELSRIPFQPNIHSKGSRL